MISVIVLGTGNVGTHLTTAFLAAENVTLTQVYSRKKSSLASLKNKVNTTTTISNLKEADVYVIAISDDAIAEFSSQLDLKNKLVVHTSGSVALNMLKNNGSKGVFYPLQTFSKKKAVHFNNIPICVEAENKADVKLLKELASSISNTVFTIDSEQRKQLHIAAVFANNFVNYLYKIAFDICEEHTIPFATLLPLISETAQKITHANPADIQTGPARRNDVKTINTHLKLLTGEHQKIYQLLTESIQKTYGEKL